MPGAEPSELFHRRMIVSEPQIEVTADEWKSLDEGIKGL